jgi:hypothetical protein
MATGTSTPPRRPHLSHRLVKFGVVHQHLVQRDSVLAVLLGVGQLRDIQLVQGHEGDAPLLVLVQVGHQLHAHLMAVHHHLRGSTQDPVSCHCISV